MAGAELGFAPFQAMQSFAVINGKPNIWGDALPALLWSRGFKIKEWFDDEDAPKKAFCRITRPDGEEIERTFSLEDARKAALLGKQGPWQQYQKRMLQMRARAFAARDGAADVLRGMHVAEEVQDYQVVTARQVPAEGPNLAARLAGPAETSEGFNAVHNTEISDEGEDQPSDSSPETPASDSPPCPDAGDTFPGDRAPAGDAETAGSAEPNGDEGTGPAVDVIAWADKLIEDLPFWKPEQIAALESDRKELAKFAILKATDIKKARDLETAILAAKEG